MMQPSIATKENFNNTLDKLMKFYEQQTQIHEQNMKLCQQKVFRLIDAKRRLKENEDPVVVFKDLNQYM